MLTRKKKFLLRWLFFAVFQVRSNIKLTEQKQKGQKVGGVQDQKRPPVITVFVKSDQDVRKDEQELYLWEKWGKIVINMV